MHKEKQTKRIKLVTRPAPAVQKLPGFRFFSSSSNHTNGDKGPAPAVAQPAAQNGNPPSSNAAAAPLPARQPNGILKNNYDKDAMNRVGQR